jgi:hypothetical protein
LLGTGSRAIRTSLSVSTVASFAMTTSSLYRVHSFGLELSGPFLAAEEDHSCHWIFALSSHDMAPFLAAGQCPLLSPPVQGDQSDDDPKGYQGRSRTREFRGGHWGVPGGRSIDMKLESEEVLLRWNRLVEWVPVGFEGLTDPVWDGWPRTLRIDPGEGKCDRGTAREI